MWLGDRKSGPPEAQEARNENGPGGWALAVAIGLVGAWFLVEFLSR